MAGPLKATRHRDPCALGVVVRPLFGISLALLQRVPSPSRPAAAVAVVPEASTDKCVLRAPAHVIGSSSRKPQLMSWKWGSDAVSLRCAQAETMLSVAVDPTGVWVAAGGVSGNLYLWRAGDGALVRVTRAHLKPISALTFAADGVRVLTGSEDCTVRSWSGVSLLDADAEADSAYRPEAQHTWRGHTLPVTSLRRCWGSGPDAPVASTSLDCSVRLFRPVSGTVLAVVSLPSPLYCSSVDMRGLRLVLGAGDGSVFVVPLRREAATDDVDVARAEAGLEVASGLLAAVPPAHVSSSSSSSSSSSASSSSVAAAPASAPLGAASQLAPAVHAALDPSCSGLEIGSASLLAGHRACVHDVVVTSDGAAAITASADGTVRVWDLASGQETNALTGLTGAATALVLVPRACAPVQGARVEPLAPLAALAKHAVPLSQRREARRDTDGIDLSAVPVAKALVPAVGGGLRAPAVGVLGSEGAADDRLERAAATHRRAAADAARANSGAVLAAVAALRAGDPATALRACGLDDVATAVGTRRRAVGGKASGLSIEMGSDEPAGAAAGAKRARAAAAASNGSAAAAAAVSSGAASPDADAEKEALRARVAELESEAARWKLVNSKLVARLRSAGSQL